MYKEKFQKTIDKCIENNMKYIIYTNIPERIEAGAISYIKLNSNCANYRLSINEVDDSGVEFKIGIRGEISYMIIPFENILCIEMFN